MSLSWHHTSSIFENLPHSRKAKTWHLRGYVRSMKSDCMQTCPCSYGDSRLGRDKRCGTDKRTRGSTLPAAIQHPIVAAQHRSLPLRRARQVLRCGCLCTFTKVRSMPHASLPPPIRKKAPIGHHTVLSRAIRCDSKRWLRKRRLDRRQSVSRLIEPRFEPAIIRHESVVTVVA